MKKVFPKSHFFVSLWSDSLQFQKQLTTKSKTLLVSNPLIHKKKNKFKQIEFSERKKSCISIFIIPLWSNGILPLNDTVFNLLKQKNPASSIAEKRKTIFTSCSIWSFWREHGKRSSIKDQRASVPPELDIDGWRKILASKSYRTINADLKSVCQCQCQNICSEILPIDKTKDETLLVAFLTCKLVPLDKNPGLQPIGIDEVLWQTAG